MASLVCIKYWGHRNRLDAVCGKVQHLPLRLILSTMHVTWAIGNRLAPSILCVIFMHKIRWLPPHVCRAQNVSSFALIKCSKIAFHHLPYHLNLLLPSLKCRLLFVTKFDDAPGARQQCPVSHSASTEFTNMARKWRCAHIYAKQRQFSVTKLSNESAAKQLKARP